MTDPLRVALEKKYSKGHISRLITARANDQYFTRRLALLSVARDAGLNVTKYATDEEMATLRSHDRGRAVAANTVPPAASLARGRQANARPAIVAKPAAAAKSAPKWRRDKVFVVHGRDGAIRDSMFAFLRAVNLDPIEWGEAVKATGKPMPYIAETLEALLAGAAAVVVVLTPDDEVVLKPRLQAEDDPEEEKKPMGQARPNVLFEGGMALGRHPEKTVFVSVGRVKSFTDVGGLLITRLNDTAAKRSEFVEKLRATGADPKTEGRTDWYKVGKFEIKDDGDGNG
jgi:Predicted nucleotide-binding protein containing TIR -like domain